MKNGARPGDAARRPGYARRMTLASNPRAVVTGGGSGIGRALCVALAKRGGRILVADLNLSGAEETAEMVRSAGGKAAVVQCDVAKREEVFRLPGLMKEHFGGTDIVFNNAGVAVSGPVADIPIADWDWLMSINLGGVIDGCLAFIPVFRAQGSGYIVNVASAAGLIASPPLAPYNVSKAAVVALSESLSVELGADGIGVSVLCPTFIRTNIHLSGRSYGKGAKENAEMVMARAKKSADDIAEITLRAVEKNKLFIVPHADGLWAWRVKRADPEAFYKRLLPPIWKKMRERLESGETTTPGGFFSELLGRIRKQR
jgi:NAD(P)-dependent dehydrogenase (short-subunit alcohol dehydrogenase family)